MTKKNTEKDIPNCIWKAMELPVPCREFRFHKTRKWRLDYAWPATRVAVEIEGGIWTGGRHTSPQGFSKDMEKYNALAEAGWVLLRYPPPGKRYDKVDWEQIRRTLAGREHEANT